MKYTRKNTIVFAVKHPIQNCLCCIGHYRLHHDKVYALLLLHHLMNVYYCIKRLPFLFVSNFFSG